MKRIRVLQVVGAMNMGGIENFVMNLFRATNRNRVQFDFLYITQKKCYFDDEIESLGGRIYRITGRNTDLKRHKKELTDFFEENGDIDAVHIHAANAFCYVDAKIARQFGIKCILVHSHTTSAPHKYLHYALRELLPKYVDRCLACSDLAAKWLFPSRLVKKTVMIPNGISLPKYRYRPEVAERLRTQYGIGNKLVIGHVGRLEEVKNHSFLLEIMQNIKRKHNDSVLLLVGDGTLKEKLQQKSMQLGLENDVIFAGIQDNANEYMQAFDIMVFPSLYEGLPVTIVEAQAAGVPCFISDVITKDVAVTELVHYVSLNCSAYQWAEIILGEYKKHSIHDDYSNQIREAGFDIQATASLLEGFYKGEQ